VLDDRFDSHRSIREIDGVARRERMTVRTVHSAQRPDARRIAKARIDSRRTKVNLAIVAVAMMSILAFLAKPAAAQAPSLPNIVYILCDDLGYGDIHALNPQRGKIPTPNVDQLAAKGMTFTDAHSGSSVCTPSRYGILTGRYAWRTRLQADVLNGDSEPLIAADRLTVPAMLKEHGYTTGIIGKWHLGLRMGEQQWTDPLKDGPLQHGFDYFFGIAASLDMPPFVYIENQRFTEEPTVRKKWVRTGPAAKDFEAINVLPEFSRRAVDYITAHAADAKAGKPFFLYLAFSAPHTPILPTPQWQGKSGISPYADFVMETDWATGQTLKAIDDAGLTENTLVIFTSDNGCSRSAKPGAAGVDGPLSERQLSRLQVRHLGRRASHSVHRALAGQSESGQFEQ
jgi:arylsulfatase A-like enzyme